MLAWAVTVPLLLSGSVACDGCGGSGPWGYDAARIKVVNKCGFTANLGVQYRAPGRPWETWRLWKIPPGYKDFLRYDEAGTRLIQTYDDAVYFYVEGAERGGHRRFYRDSIRYMRRARFNGDDFFIRIPCRTGPPPPFTSGRRRVRL